MVKQRSIISRRFFFGNYREAFFNIFKYLYPGDAKHFSKVSQSTNATYNQILLNSVYAQRIVELNQEKGKRKNIVIDAFNEIQKRRQENPKKIDIEKMSNQMQVVDTIEEFNNNFKEFCGGKKNTTWKIMEIVRKRLSFFIAGSSVLYSMLKRPNETNIFSKDKKEALEMIFDKNFKDADIDIFCALELNPTTLKDKGIKSEKEFMEYRDSNLRRKNKELHSLLEDIKKVIDYEYYVTRHNEVLAILPKDPKKHRKIQIVLKDYQSLQTHLVFADLDCTRFALFGNQVLSTQEGINALFSKKNILPKHLSKVSFMDRIEKYEHRGFQTKFERVSFFKEDTDEKDLNTKNIEDREDIDYGAYSNIDVSYALVDDCIKNKGPPQAENVESKKRINPFTFKLNDKLEGSIEVSIYNTIKHFLSIDRSLKYKEFTHSLSLAYRFQIRRCYICRKFISYQSKKKCLECGFCSKCLVYNTKMRKLNSTMNNRIAIVTGARIKIGFACCLKLLRAGCTVIGTTRFVKDARYRYRKERDFHQWKNNLYLFPLDLKNGENVTKFIRYIKSNFPKIHVLINNAAITVRRPIQYYKTLIGREYYGLKQIERKKHLAIDIKPGKKRNNKNKQIISTHSKENKNEVYKADQKFGNRTETKKYMQLIRSTLSSVQYYMNDEDRYSRKEGKKYFPPRRTDQYGEQIDLRRENSWTQKINELDPIELLEVQAVNNIAPQILVSQLFENLIPHNNSKSPSYVINVTSDEGFFDEYSRFKNSNHPHTNISKSALNQLTRSSATYFAKNGVLMNSVDVGWSSSARLVVLRGLKAPLSMEDAAARTLHPIFSRSELYGKLFCNFQPVRW